jgi:hypothetical protein
MVTHVDVRVILCARRLSYVLPRRAPVVVKGYGRQEQEMTSKGTSRMTQSGAVCQISGYMSLQILSIAIPSYPIVPNACTLRLMGYRMDEHGRSDQYPLHDHV